MDGGGGGAISGRLPGGGCAIGRGIGVLDNSQQLGKPKMGYAFCTSTCFCCGRNFSHNPLRVPSFRDPRTGTRKPICLRCVEMSIRTASSAASNQSSRCQKHTIHTIHSIAICHEPDQEKISNAR